MASIRQGKDFMREWILERTQWTDVILDVGACDGVWADLLPERNLVAVEAFAPNAERIRSKYLMVHCKRIQDFAYVRGFYKLAIFGDVLEHMTVEDAQTVLAYAAERCADVIVALPFEYPQGAIYGNPFEVHIQPDLTPEIVAERYPMLEMLIRPVPNYAYYHLKGREI